MTTTDQTTLEQMAVEAHKAGRKDWHLPITEIHANARRYQTKVEHECYIAGYRGERMRKGVWR
jgi:hypothetical protein